MLLIFIVKRIKLLVFREMSLNFFFFSVVFFQLNSDLVSTVSNIMEADSALLVEAQRRSKACSRFVLHSKLASELVKRTL